MSKTKSKTAERAVATLRQPTDTDTLKISVTHSLAQAMSQSPEWPAATDVQADVQTWTTSADALDANSKVIADLKAQLYAAEVHQLTLRRDWLAAKARVIAGVTLFCGGSVARVRSFTFDVVSHGRIGPLGAPASLSVNPGKELGEVVSTWDKGLARHGFLVQHAADPANPATISSPQPCTRPSFVLTGLSPNASVNVRVAAIDPASPDNLSPWSAWVLGNAR